MLVEPSPSSILPTQCRPSSITSSIKNRNFRIAGLTNKFSRKSDLQTFQKKVFKHLKDHGLDTITYLPDPSNPNAMTSVVTNHDMFTLDEAEKEEKVQAKAYDPYDLANIVDAK